MFIPATSRRFPCGRRERLLDPGPLGQQRRRRGAGPGPDQLFAGQPAPAPFTSVISSS